MILSVLVDTNCEHNFLWWRSFIVNHQFFCIVLFLFFSVNTTNPVSPTPTPRSNILQPPYTLFPCLRRVYYSVKSKKNNIAKNMWERLLNVCVVLYMFTFKGGWYDDILKEDEWTYHDIIFFSIYTYTQFFQLFLFVSILHWWIFP